MKKLQKLVLHKATKMTAPQMKHITGGYGATNTGCAFNSSSCGGSCSVELIDGSIKLGLCEFEIVGTVSGCVCNVE